eukprot:CAMPEP_0204567904 /NCGR_PEP_ID=MMETSP0661-20131031/36863_1 /ASSEMBLY_ACC=CAM_ASM_000606 /TAXON_ID=109239 /ORGANISM="Alexandrium margalefi, Strain AMGDE01CS-322" /LENGTH=72 /DNA_ID=CAMNT_0051575861 /DNA_START=221 /DNA_END=439 /DNA_ORIENTATION=+
MLKWFCAFAAADWRAVRTGLQWRHGRNSSSISASRYDLPRICHRTRLNFMGEPGRFIALHRASSSSPSSSSS